MPSAERNERLEFRVPEHVKQLIERAAALDGQTVSGFAINALVRRARRVLKQQATIELNDRDRDIFITMLDNSEAEPNEALKRAAERYKTHIG